MRIDGMDAANVKFRKVAEVHTLANEPKLTTKDNSNVIIDNKNISQLTEMEKQELPISERIIINAIEKANKAIAGSNRKLQYSVHEQTKEIMVKVINSDTNEVVREFPPEKILDMIAKMWEMAGLIVDERR